MEDPISFIIEERNSQYFVCHTSSKGSIIKIHPGTQYPTLQNDKNTFVKAI